MASIPPLPFADTIQKYLDQFYNAVKKKRWDVVGVQIIILLLFLYASYRTYFLITEEPNHTNIQATNSRVEFGNSFTSTTSVSIKAQNYGGNQAINNTAPVTQTLIQNKYPSSKFTYTLATSSYQAIDGLYHYQFNLDLIHAPGVVSDILVISAPTAMNCEYVSQWAASTQVNGMIEDTNQMNCTFPQFIPESIINSGSLLKLKS